MLVDGVAASRYAIGFFGFTHFRKNFFSLKMVPIEDTRFPDYGPVTPSVTSVTNGSYKPLSRTLYLYASLCALQNRELLEFLEFYLIHAAENVTRIGNIPHSDQVYREYLAKIDLYKERLAK
jgi:phosphate transport system substrate-binding protein